MKEMDVVIYDKVTYAESRELYRGLGKDCQSLPFHGEPA